MILKATPLRRDKVREEILNMITGSSMNAGDRLLSEKKIGEMLKVNHLTVRAALAELADQGIVERVSGSGTFFTGKSTTVSAHTGNIPEVVAAMVRNDDHFFSNLHSEISHALQAGHFMVTTQYSHTEVEDTFEDLKQMFSWKAPSIIVLQAEIEKSDRLRAYFNQHAAGCRRVIRLLGNLCNSAPFAGHQVSIDYAGAYRQAVHHLKTLGHKHIAYFGASCDESVNCHQANRKYVSLYTEAMIAEGLAGHINVACTSEASEFEETALELLSRPNRPTAVCCITDHRGVIIKEAAEKLGLKVPQDLSIIGFYDTPWSQHFHLSTFRVRCHEIAECIADLFKQERTESGLTLIPLDYVERKSVAKPSTTV